MQDRYAGDVGDYGKFALLRALTCGPKDNLALSVVWCRYPNENHNGDGRHLAYLDRNDFAVLDPKLHTALRNLVLSDRRSLSAIERSAILPPSTVYFSDLVMDAAVGPQLGEVRTNRRREWRERALSMTSTTDLVFFDPDNGIETASIPKTHPKAGKYIYWEDLIPFWRRGQSLVVYHHLNRTASASAQTEALRTRFTEHLGSAAFLLPLLFRRGSCRHFWIVGQPKHMSYLKERVIGFLSGGWKHPFNKVEYKGLADIQNIGVID